MKNKKIYDVLIIGGGPGGISASIYAKRSNMEVAFIEKSAPGGKVVMTSMIENYPGFNEISGFELATKFYEQAKILGVEHLYGEVISFKAEKDIFLTKTKDDTIFYSKTLILATGMTENKFGIPGEEKFSGKNISYCAICDGSFYKDKAVAVLGGGNSALKEARFLAKIAKKVYLVHRFDYFEGQKLEIDLTKKTPNIEIKMGKLLKSFDGDKKLESITYQDDKTKVIETLKIDGAFCFIGYKPITNYINQELVKLDRGFIVTNNLTQTLTKGIFAIGDVTIKPYRQIIISAAEGAIAALEAEKFINE